MANSNSMTEEHAGGRLLIGTWNDIGATVKGSQFNRDRIFQTLPICHMWQKLEPAVVVFRATLGQDYAADFEWLYNEFLGWVEPKGSAYKTQSCNGMQALFG